MARTGKNGATLYCDHVTFGATLVCVFKANKGIRF